MNFMNIKDRKFSAWFKTSFPWETRRKQCHRHATWTKHINRFSMFVVEIVLQRVFCKHEKLITGEPTAL